MPKSFDCDVALPETKWLVKDLVPLGHLCVLLAQSGAGKSFVLEALALHVAYKKDFCEFETSFGDVLIIDQDTPTDVLKSRLIRMSKTLGQKAANRIELASMEDYSLSNYTRLVNMINDVNAKLVIIDSLHSLCGGLNPNSTSDMSVWAHIKSKCLNEDRTIIVSHHITEHLELSLADMMDGNKHISGMGNSTIKQQTDTEYILASTIEDGRIGKIYLRPVAKRRAISQKPVCMRLIEPDDEKMIVEFNGYWEADLSEVEQDCMLLITETNMEFSIKEVRDKMGNKYGEKAIRESLVSLERKGRLVMSRHKSNLFKYRLPRIA